MGVRMEEAILQAVNGIQASMKHLFGQALTASWPGARASGRSLLDASEEIDIADSDYLAKKLTPLFMGGAIGVIVLVSYLLFFLVSACCKCCSKKRGCCQRPQEKMFKQRIPYIAIISIVAVIGAVGGILVISAGPKTVDTLLDDLQAITDGTVEALGLADIENESVDDLTTTSDEIRAFREEDLQDTLDAADGILKLISTIAMAVGGVLMGISLLGLFGAAFLQSWMLSSFLLLAFLVNWSAWVLFGAFAVTGGILTDICVAVDEVVAGAPSRLPEMDCSGVATTSLEAIAEIKTGIVDAITAANIDIAEANSEGPDVVAMLNTTCNQFNSGNSLYNELCTASPPSGSSDSSLLTAVYQCVDVNSQPDYNVYDGLSDTSLCTWQATSNTVNFGSNVTYNCFDTTTALLNVPDYRGIVEAASLQSTSSNTSTLLDADFVQKLTSTLRLGCGYDSGSGGIVNTFLTPTSFPLLCAPYASIGSSFMPVTPQDCAASGLIPLADVEANYQQYACNNVAAENENNITREACVVMGTPLFQTEFTGMVKKAAAVVIFQTVIERLHRFVTCAFVLELMTVLATHCHPLADTLKMLGTGCLLSGIGLTLTALFICSCWRKITKPAHGKVAPGDEDKALLQPSSP